VAASQLRSTLGIEVFAPQIRFKRATRRGVVWVTEALFPNYVFARFEPVSMRQVKHTLGVSKIVQFGGVPAIVPDNQLRALQESMQGGELYVAASRVGVGDTVRVVTGPMKGSEAVVSAVMPAKDRIKVLLNVLGGEQEVEVSLASVLPPHENPLRD
jgi:transcription antitermination factor NusG